MKSRLAIVIIVGIILLVPATIHAEMGWSEKFDDSSSLDNWNPAYGEWVVEDGHLVVTDCEPALHEDCYTSIWHEQSTIVGTWSFDILHTGDEDFGTLFYFIGNGDAGADTNATEFHPAEGYVIHVWGNDGIDLDYVTGGSYRYSPGTYSPGRDLTGWFHIDVSRDTDGLMKVYLNGTSIINATNKYVTFSENMNIQTEVGVQFDNIQFSGTPDSFITPVSDENSSDLDVYPVILIFLPYATLIYSKRRCTKS